MTRTLIVSALVFFGCSTERRDAETAPLLSCVVQNLTDGDDGWAGTFTMLMAPPGSFNPGDLVRGFAANGTEVDISNDHHTEPRVLANGGLHVRVEGRGVRLNEFLRVTFGTGESTREYLVRTPTRQARVELVYTPAIIEQPQDQMLFRAVLPAPLDMGVFSNTNTDEVAEIEPPDPGNQLVATIPGREGQRGYIGLRLTDGSVVCIHNPCGCSPEVYAAGGCRYGSPPSGDPPD